MVTHNNGPIGGSDRQVASQEVTLYAGPGTDVMCGARWDVDSGNRLFFSLSGRLKNLPPA
jgi:hypothetical protein